MGPYSAYQGVHEPVDGSGTSHAEMAFAAAAGRFPVPSEYQAVADKWNGSDIVAFNAWAAAVGAAPPSSSSGAPRSPLLLLAAAVVVFLLWE